MSIGWDEATSISMWHVQEQKYAENKNKSKKMLCGPSYFLGGCRTVGTSLLPKKTARKRTTPLPSFRPRCHFERAWGNPCPALNSLRPPSANSTISVPSSAETYPWTGCTIHSDVVP